ncbi:hypothetical protein ACTG16_12035 [Aeromonas sp. 23P]|uniref:hypothetical protein n=1 Tax=unclassified Aeromonas TaxID=257493 RepID=UPI003F78F6C8
MQNNIVGALLERAGSQQGQENALLMLRHMLVGDQLTALGCQVLDEMNRAFCAEVREMLDQGKDPAVELTQESKRRAMQ